MALTKEFTQVSDADALLALDNEAERRARPTTVFCPRTVVYPIKVKYNESDEAQTQIRILFTCGNYITAEEWDLAQEVETRYKQLNTEYRANCERKNVTWHLAEPTNPLRMSILT